MESHCVSVIFPNQLHRITFSPDAEGVILMFDEALFCSDILKNELKAYNYNLYNKLNIISRERINYNQIRKMIHHVTFLFNNITPIRKEQIRFYIKILLLQLIEDVHEEIQPQKNLPTVNLYARYKGLIDNQYAENKAVKEYARQMGITTKRLNTICKIEAKSTALAVITDRKKGVKYPIVSYELTPDVAIVDGELCATMPAKVTANTGLDALTHCVEAYVSNIEDNYADAFAKGGIELVFANLETAVNEPANLEARQNMHDASCLGGFAFTNAWLGIVHSLAHQVGVMYGVPHGCANAILLPNVIRYNSKVTGKYTDLAKMFGGETAEDFAQKVEALRKSTGVPSSLKEYGIDATEWKKNLDYITRNAMDDPCTGFNPRKPTLDELSRIYEACFEDVKVDF